MPNTPNTITRRTFLKKAATATACTASVALGVEVATPLLIDEKMAFERNKSVWGEFTIPESGPLKTSGSVDIAVIGGGYTGLSAALHIKQRFPQKTVVILEAKYLGYGASGRNGGMCLTQPSNDYMTLFHPKTHRKTYEITAEYIKKIVTLMTRHGLAQGVTFDGGLRTIYKKNRVNSNIRYVEIANGMGMPLEFWDQNQVADALGTDAYYGGIFEPTAAEIHPVMMVDALKREAEQKGVLIFDHSLVTRIDQGKRLKLTVQNKTGQTLTLTCKNAVLATNAYTSKLGFFRHHVMTTHTEMASTPVLGKDIFNTIGWKKRVPFHDDNIYLYHFGSTKEGRIMIGAGNAEYFFNNGMTYRKKIAIREQALKEEMCKIFPGLCGIDFEYVWTGPLCISLDFEPSVGVTGDYQNIYYGLGYAAHGMCMAFLFGRIISDTMAGDTQKWEDLPFFQHSFIPIPPEPLRFLGIHGYLSCLKMLDKR